MLRFVVLALAAAAASASLGVRGSRQQTLANVAEAEGEGVSALECDPVSKLPRDVTPHPDYAKILAAVKALPQATWDEDLALFRVQDVEFPRVVEIINGMGAYHAGGRFGAKCIAQAYFSRDDTTALEECKAASVREKTVQTYPRLLVAAYYTGKTYVDLTGAKMGALATATGAAATVPDTEKWHDVQTNKRESWTQAVGRAVVESGSHAMLVSSKAHPGGVNLVVFPGPNPTAMLAVDDQDRLETLTKIGTMSEAQIQAARGAAAVQEPVLEVGYPEPAASGEVKWTNNPMHCKKHCNPK